jgi:hypothetical protein
MTRIFNPPPNWPQPPRNWSPPPDWQPDPAWGPAPPGWQLWIDDASPAAAPVKQPKEKRIFISYRRGDCQPQANAINDGLRHRIHPAHIFMDIDSIPPGVDFEEHVRNEIKICDVVLVLIGDDWLSATTYDGTRRIDDPDDFVRLEIESALASPRVSLVPVLVEGAEMPRAAELPESIRAMARINAIELSDQRWTSDIERLANVIREHSEPVPQPVQQPVLAPVAPAQPQYYAAVPPVPVPKRSTRPPPPDWVGTVMVLVPILSCGFLSFVPSIWVAVMRRDHKQAMVRSLVLAAIFVVVDVAAFIAVGTAPKDAEGSPTGIATSVTISLVLVSAVVAAVLAFVQRDPTKGFEPR